MQSSLIAGLLAAALATSSGVVLPAHGAQEVPAVSGRTWAKADNFWYRRAAGDGHVWINVDARHGAKTPLFDHQRLAIELNLRTGSDFTPSTLPFADPASRFVVKYDGSNAYIQEGAMAIEFVLDRQYWRCELQIKWDWNKVPPTDYECLPRRPAPAAPPMPAQTGTAAHPLRSPDGAHEAFVEKHNVYVRTAAGGEARALTADGTDGDAYDPGSLQWSPDSRSLDAYRLNAAIWQSAGVTGTVRQHIVHRTLPTGGLP